jgi:hypothetical protein
MSWESCSIWKQSRPTLTKNNSMIRNN